MSLIETARERTPQQRRHTELRLRDRLIRFELRGAADARAGALRQVPRLPRSTVAEVRTALEAAWLRGYDGRRRSE